MYPVVLNNYNPWSFLLLTKNKLLIAYIVSLVVEGAAMYLFKLYTGLL